MTTAPSSSASGALMLARRLLLVLGVALLGALVAWLLGLIDLADSTWFPTTITIALAIGLFTSTSAIPVGELRSNWRVVVSAVTLGVLLKAALITAVMYALFADPAYLVIGVALAQIDPLAVAALSGRTRLSPRGRVVLAAWSSFDDPVTTVLVILLVGVAVRAGAGDGGDGGGFVMEMPLVTTLANVLLALAAAVVWWLALQRLPGSRARAPDGAAPSRYWLVLALVVLLALGAVAVDQFLLLGLAVVGLFFRPGIDLLLERATSVAFAVATLMLGMVAAGGIDLGQGIVLGITAYGAQVVAGYLVAWRLPDDRLRLALSQQSGVTAILLALLLEPVIPGTVATVAPAVLTVNVLHLVANSTADALEDRASRIAVAVRSRGRRDEPVAGQAPSDRANGSARCEQP
jgi:hypothetical protein